MVDVAQRTALGACLTTPGDLIPDLNAANRECFGGNSHLDWNDFADINTVREQRICHIWLCLNLVFSPGS